MTEELKPHKLAEIFPLLPDDDLQALAEDIKANGLRQKITLYEGKILDGRNRYKACKIANVQHETEEYEGDDPIGFVISINVMRRHLNASQRAMIAANLEVFEHGGKRQHANSHLVTRDAAAKMMNVGKRSIADAKSVISSGNKQLINEVKSGKKTVSAAAKEINNKNKPTKPHQDTATDANDEDRATSENAAIKIAIAAVGQLGKTDLLNLAKDMQLNPNAACEALVAHVRNMSGNDDAEAFKAA